MIKYSQFVQVRSKKAIDFHKNKIKQNFALLDQRRSNVDTVEPVKSGHLHKKDIKKLFGAIFSTNNDLSENYFKDFDKDADDFLTVDETIAMVIQVTSHL